MEKLKIPKKGIGVSKTLRLPSNIVEDIETLSKIKNISLNQTVIQLVEFSLAKLDREDREQLEIIRNRVVG